MQIRLIRGALIATAAAIIGALILLFCRVLPLAAPEAVGTPFTSPTVFVPLSEVPASPTESTQPAAATATNTEIGFNRPSSTPPDITAFPTSTLSTNPTLLLTSFVPPTETATPQPLSGLGADIELPIVQLRLINVSQEATILVEVSNFTEQPLEQVRLIFATPDGQRVGSPVALNLTLLPGESRPGASATLNAGDPIIQDWDNLQAHAVGTPPTTRPGEAGYPISLTVSYPDVSRDQTNLHYSATVVNDTGTRVAISGQSIAFYGEDGTLLFVENLGTHGPLAASASYALNGTLPLDHIAADGHTLVDATDVIINISAEIAP